MNVQEIFQISAAVLSSVGGAALILFGLSSWLGKVWANRILAKEKAQYSAEIERLRADLKDLTERNKIVFARYFDGQFKVYNELWISLVDLENGVNALWDVANERNLKSFVVALRRANKQIRESALLIDPGHYTIIMKVLKEFSDYQIGKETLLANRQNFKYINQYEIDEIVQSNSENRDKILAFIEGMLSAMRMQIGGLPTSSANQAMKDNDSAPRPYRASS